MCCAGLAGLDLELGAMAAAAEAAEARAEAAEAAVCERDAVLAEARADLAQLRADKRAAECVPCTDGKALLVLIAACALIHAVFKAQFEREAAHKHRYGFTTACAYSQSILLSCKYMESCSCVKHELPHKHVSLLATLRCTKCGQPQDYRAPLAL